LRLLLETKPLGGGGGISKILCGLLIQGVKYCRKGDRDLGRRQFGGVCVRRLLLQPGYPGEGLLKQTRHIVGRNFEKLSAQEKKGFLSGPRKSSLKERRERKKIDSERGKPALFLPCRFEEGRSPRRLGIVKNQCRTPGREEPFRRRGRSSV